MANTHATAGTLAHRGTKLVKSYETSAADTALTVSTPITRGRPLRLVAVLVKYSGSVTKNATVTYNASHGAGYDSLLNTIALSSATSGAYVPAIDLIIASGDTIDVVAEAGGGAVTSGVTILTEEF